MRLYLDPNSPCNSGFCRICPTCRYSASKYQNNNPIHVISQQPCNGGRCGKCITCVPSVSYRFETTWVNQNLQAAQKSSTNETYLSKSNEKQEENKINNKQNEISKMEWE